MFRPVKIYSTSFVLIKLSILIYLSLNLFLKPIYLGAQPTSTLFSDQVWYFGLNENVGLNPDLSNMPYGTPFTSRGVIFRKNGATFTPTDASKQSAVSSYENSLSVSTPACNGSFVFYTSADKIYNTNHVEMKCTTPLNKFQGHNSVADGLAAAYLGDNKYIVFSVAQWWNNAIDVALNYYIVDMNNEGGLGSYRYGGNITYGVSESIELVPKPGTWNQYWLIFNQSCVYKPHYPNCEHLNVYSVDGTNSANPSVVFHSRLSYPVANRDQYGWHGGLTFMLKANKTCDKIVLTNPASGKLDLFNFNPNTGRLTNNYSWLIDPEYVYGAEFSPSGQYVYVSTYNSTPPLDGNIWQVNINTRATRKLKLEFNGGGDRRAGAIKLGPDNKMYFIKSNRRQLGVIDDPDNANSTLNSYAFVLSSETFGGGFSTGITKPWINPPNVDLNVPSSADDHVSTNKVNPIVIYPLLNDQAGTKLTGVWFENPNHNNVKGTVSFNPALGTVTFTPKAAYLVLNETVQLRYSIKSNAVPISQCSDASLIHIKISDCDNFVIASNSSVGNQAFMLSNSNTKAQLKRTFEFTGAKSSQRNRITYNLVAQVTKGKVNGVGTGQNLLSTSGIALNLLSGAGKFYDLSQTFQITAPFTSAEVRYTLKIKDDDGTLPVCEKEYQFTVKLDQTCSMFSDDIWFFGANADNFGGAATGPPNTSKGLFFSRNPDGSVAVNDYSGRSSVNTHENTLSVSMPLCGESFLFYTSHNQVFNRNHQVMSGGSFVGHGSIADGLAAAYLGNNKYILFAGNAPFELAMADNLRTINYYIIDMNGDNGLGTLTSKGAVPGVVNMSEALELVPKMGSANAYWLMYYDKLNRRLRTYSVNSNNNSTNPNLTFVSDILVSVPTNYIALSIKPNSTFTKLSVCLASPNTGGGGQVDVYNLDPSTGKLTFDLSYPVSTFIPYSSEFSLGGQYLYMALINANGSAIPGNLIQYDLNAKFAVRQVPYPPFTKSYSGGGIKMGPDGKIYLLRSVTTDMGVIDYPDLSFNSGGGVNWTGFQTSLPGGHGLQFSTGLTPSALCLPGVNQAPITSKVIAHTNQYSPVVINALAGDVDPEGGQLFLTHASFVDPTEDGLLGSISYNSKEVTFTPNPKYTFTDGQIVHLKYVVKDNGNPISSCSEGAIEVNMFNTKKSSDLFTDNVWFFGTFEQAYGEFDWNNTDPLKGTLKSSKGVIFNEQNIPRDASRISMVNTVENSLSVSTPACHGGFIFYTSHQQVFNANHKKMKNGDFLGHPSTGDALAAAYLGDNQYILFSADGEKGSAYRYYIIDMDGDNGFGELKPGAVIEPSGVNESVELVPKVGTFNEYWLILNRSSTSEIKVYHVSAAAPASPTSPIIKLAHSIAYITGNMPPLSQRITFNMKANKSYNQIAMTDYAKQSGELFDFNPATGEIKWKKSYNIANYGAKPNGGIYGVAFSPKGQYLYLTQYAQDNLHFQINLSTDEVKTFKLAEFIPDPTYSGADMKLGPDDKIYIKQHGQEWMSVINSPDLPIDAPGNLELNGLKLSSKAYGIKMSTGLTPPWINPTGSVNYPPKANNDYVYTFKGLSVIVWPIVNDTDDGGQANIVLNKVVFADPAKDSIQGIIVENFSNKNFTFTPNIDHNFNKDEFVMLDYTIKDRGNPVHLCDQASVFIMIKNDPEIMIKDSCSFKPYLFIDHHNIPLAYQWEYKLNLTDPWVPIVGAGTYRTEAKTPGFYRLKLWEASDPNVFIHTKAIELIKLKEFNLANGIFYQMEIQR